LRDKRGLARPASHVPAGNCDIIATCLFPFVGHPVCVPNIIGTRNQDTIDLQAAVMPGWPSRHDSSSMEKIRSPSPVKNSRCKIVRTEREIAEGRLLTRIAFEASSLSSVVVNRPCQLRVRRFSLADHPNGPVRLSADCQQKKPRNRSDCGAFRCSVAVDYCGMSPKEGRPSFVGPPPGGPSVGFSGITGSFEPPQPASHVAANIANSRDRTILISNRSQEKRGQHRFG